jgi:hypothetical protein
MRVVRVWGSLGGDRRRAGADDRCVGGCGACFLVHIEGVVVRMTGAVVAVGVHCGADRRRGGGTKRRSGGSERHSWWQ